MSHDEEYLQRHLEEMWRVHGLSHNDDIRVGYATWLAMIQDKYQQDASQLLGFCVQYVETLQSALPISETKIHFVEFAQKIANLYRDQPEQRTTILAVLNELLTTGESYFEKLHTFKRYVAHGMYDLKDILERTQALWDLQHLYHHGEFQFSAGLLVLLDRYIDLFTPYHGLIYDERHLLIKNLQLEIVKQYPEEILNLFLFAIEHDAYFHHWVSKELFFVLMEQKDKRLNQSEILQKLVENQGLIIKKMIYAKPFILHLAFSIGKVAKAKQLNRAIVDAMSQISFIQHNTQSIPRKRLEQIQQQVHDFAIAFQQENGV